MPLYYLKEKEKKIETMVCFLDRLFVIMLSFSLGLPSSLIIFGYFQSYLFEDLERPP